MKKTGTLLVLAVVGVFGFMIQPSFGAEAPIVIKYAHQAPLTDPAHKAAEYFARQLAERTKGKVKVDIYPASMLYKDTEIIPAVRDGAIQMGMGTINQMESYIPIAEVYSLPFLTPSHEHMKKIKEGVVGKLLVGKMDGIGLKHMFWMDVGFTDLATTKKLVKRPDDLKGLKIRIVGGKMTSDTFKALGASPVFITATEVYMALSKGAADGLISVFNSFYNRKYYEIAKYASKLNLYFSCHPVIMNMKFWESLPDDVRKVINEVRREAEERGEKWGEEDEISAINKCKEKGMAVYYITPEERAQFVDAVQPVWEDFAKRYGKEGGELVQWIKTNR